LQGQIDALRVQAAAARDAQEAAGLDDGLGLQVEFESFPEARNRVFQQLGGAAMSEIEYLGHNRLPTPCPFGGPDSCSERLDHVRGRFKIARFSVRSRYQSPAF